MTSSMGWAALAASDCGLLLPYRFHQRSSSTTAAAVQARPANMPAHGTAAHEDAEKAVTGSAATKAQAAAVKAAGGGTAGSVTTNFTGNGYEVTVTKSGGSSVEIDLDSSFNAQQGPGGPGA